MKVSIIIPNYNTEFLLRKNLPIVLAAAANPENQILEVILVDDASPDKSAEVVKKEFPQIRLIRHKVNRGFSSAVNTGVRMAKGGLVALLNTDVLPDKDFLKLTLPLFDDEKVFAVSLHEKGYAWAKACFKEGFIAHEPGPVSKTPHISFWASGGSAVFRRDYWIKLGGMDEKVFSPFYWEDLDLSYRAMKRGMRVLWDPDAHVVHKHESTISQLSKAFTQRIRERNELFFIWKNITSNTLFRKHISGLFRRVARHPGYFRIVFLALLKLPVVAKARKKEKKESKVSDETIFVRFK
jgi:GT2 family glycosyltransferase